MSVAGANESREAEARDRHEAKPTIEALGTPLGHEHLVVVVVERVAQEQRLDDSSADAASLAVWCDEDVGDIDGEGLVRGQGHGRPRLEVRGDR